MTTEELIFADHEEAASVALAIPDPRQAPIPQGWAIETFAPRIDEMVWEDLDDLEAELRGLVSYIESLESDSVELEKAHRIVEFRRGVLLDPDVTPGRPAVNSPRVENYGESDGTAARYRKIARNWYTLVWPHVVRSTDKRELSQAAVLRLIDEHQRNEVGPARPKQDKPGPSTNGNGQPPGAGMIAGDAETTSGGPTEEPEQDSADTIVELAKELEAAHAKIEEQQALIDSLTKDDLGAQIATLQDRLIRQEGHFDSERATAQGRDRQQRRTISSYRRTLESAKELLRVDSFGEIVPALQDLLR